MERPGIDEIVDGEAGVRVIFHVLRDWQIDGPAAEREARAKAAACLAYLRSDEFRAAHGGKPGMLVLKSTFAPPPAIVEELALVGAEVKVGAIHRDGNVTCALCRQGGFTDAQGAITDDGWACLRCFDRWKSRREEDYHARFKRGHDRVYRIIGLTVAVAVVAFVLWRLYCLIAG